MRCNVSGCLSRYLIYTVLILLILATGCDKVDNDIVSESVNLFEETEIPISSDFQFLSMKKVNDDRYVCSYLDPEDQAYHLAYTDPEFTSITPILNDAARFVQVSDLIAFDNPYDLLSIGHRLVFNVDEQGNLYVLHFQTVEKNSHPSPDGAKVVNVYDRTGVLTEKVTIDSPGQIPYMQPGKLLVRNNRIFLVAETGILIANLEGKVTDELAIPSGKVQDPMRGEERTLPIGRIIDADLMSDDAMVIVQEKSTGKMLTAYDLSNKKLLWEQSFPSNFVPVAVQYIENQHQIFVASSDKVFAFDADGTENGELIDFNQYASGQYNSRTFQGMEALHPASFYFGQSDVMYVYMKIFGVEQQIKKLYAYRFLSGDEKLERLADLKKVEDDKVNITVFVPYIDGVLEQVIMQYEKLNPQVNIHLMYYRKDIEEFNPVDYAQMVNLQLFTNKNHWDLMALQLLPYRTYIEKGYFAELDQIDLKQWVNINEQLFSNILDAVRMDGKMALFPTRILMYANYADIHAAKGLQPLQYTWDDLIERAHAIKKESSSLGLWSSFITSGTVFNSLQYDLLANQGNPEIQKQLLNQYLDIMKVLSEPDDRVKSAQERALFNVTPFFPSQFPMHLDLLGSEIELLPGPASPLSGKHAFTLQEGYAINKDSQVKEEALKFLSFVAEYTIPNNPILQRTFVELNERYGTTDANKQAIARLQSIVENLDVLRNLDFRLSEAVMSTAESYINGMMDKETAVRTMMDKLWLFENE